MVERGDENLPVADLPGPCSSRNGLDDAIRLLARHRDLHAQLGQEIHGIFGAAVDFRVPLLSPVAFYFRDRHTAYPESGERLPDFVELERLDDRDDELHNGAPLCVLRRPTREPAFAEHLWPRCGRPVQTNYSNDLFKNYARCRILRQKESFHLRPLLDSYLPRNPRTTSQRDRDRSSRGLYRFCTFFHRQTSSRRSLSKPSCATDATSVPFRVKIKPRAKPRAPPAFGLSCA